MMNGTNRPMILAHELQEHMADAVMGVNDDVDDAGKPIYRQVDLAMMIAAMLAELQSLRRRVKALEAAAGVAPPAPLPSEAPHRPAVTPVRRVVPKVEPPLEASTFDTPMPPPTVEAS